MKFKTKIATIFAVAAMSLGTGIAVAHASTTAPVASSSRPHGFHLADPSTFQSLDGYYLNGSGAGCANYTHIIGWSTGGYSNEVFNTYVDSSGQYWEFQATWCAGAGSPYTGQCIWDNSNSNHGLVLYPCNPGSSIDQFYQQLNNSQHIYQLINEYWGKYANSSAQGQWAWDGGYVRYQADWHITFVP